MTPTIEVITAPERLASLKHPWRELWERAGADVFQSHEWINAWSQTAAAHSDARLRIAVAWQNGALVAVLPMVVRRRLLLRRLEWVARDHADYCDALVEPDGDTSLLRDLWIAVCRSGGFDLVRLTQVRPDARVRPSLDSADTASGSLELRDNQQPCLGINNRWANGEAWFRSLNKKARNNFTRGRRILSELGGNVTLRIVNPAEETVAPVLEHVLDMKRRWLEASEPRSPMLASRLDRQRAVLNAAAETGLMRVFLLECGGTVSAASVNFVYPTKLQAYLTAYDPQYERASPGTILIIDYIKWAFDRHLSYVDFLRGDEPFKHRFANSETRLKGYIGAQTLLGRLALEQLGWYSGAQAAWMRRRTGSAPKVSGDHEAVAPLVHEH
jgi:CelD/BcsL family acetyltransferase involved in cellulose biosynthesis